MKSFSNKLFRGNRKYIWLFAVLTLIILFWFLRKEPVAVVEKTSVQEVVVKKSVSASGQIKSINQVNLSFLTAGTIKTINVKEGDLVKKGDNLANIDNYSNYMLLQQYKDARDIAIRDRDLFLAQYLNHQDEIGGPIEFDIQYRRQNEIVSKAESAYKESSANTIKTYISAPFNGTVIDITKKVGETAVVGETVIKLADLNDLIFEASLDQSDFGQINLGQKVEITLDSYEATIFTGNITAIPKFANTIDNNEFEVEITIDTVQTKPVLLGMRGDAIILTQKTSTKVRALQFDQIINENGKNYVWVVRNDRIYKNEIEIGLEGDLYTEIKTLLNEELATPVENSFTKQRVIKDGIKIKWLKK